MDFSDCIPAFAREMTKLGLQAVRQSAEEKAEAHFSSEKPDWKAFNKNLRSKKFREAVSKHPLADAKLKKYVKNYGGYVTSKDEVAQVTSATSGKTYRVKDLHTGRLACGCPDWKYRRSVRQGSCKHIRALEKSHLKLKEAFVKEFRRGLHIGTMPFVMANRASKARAKAKAVGNVTQQIVSQDRQKYGG